MANKSVKAALDEQLAGITVSPQLEKRILALPNARQKARRRSMVALVVVLLLLFALTGFAATSSSFQTLLMRVGDEIAHMLQPIELVSESNGIRMEVVAAMSDDHSAVAYFTLQDLTGQERLKGLIDPYDCRIEGTYVTNTRTATYDEDRQTAMLSVLCYGGESLYGRKVTFALHSFLAGRTEYDDIPVDLSLSAFQDETDAVWLAKDIIAGYGYRDLDEITRDAGLKILPPNQMRIPVPGVDFAYISNIGVVEGRLHVQVCFPKKQYTPFQPDIMNQNMDDHGEVWLLGADGPSAQREYSALSVSFAVDEQGELCSAGYSMKDIHTPPSDKVHYQEYVFAGKPDLAPYTLRGSFATNRAYITGDWNVTFRLEAVKAYKQADCDIDVGTARIRTVMVSPMGWTLIGEKKDPDAEVQATMLVNRKDGSQESFAIMATINDGTHFEYHDISEKPLDIGQIQEVSIHGQAVHLVGKQ